MIMERERKEREGRKDGIDGIGRFFSLSHNVHSSSHLNLFLQALYYCRPFRDRLLEHHAATRGDDSLLEALGDLFSQAHAASEAAAARVASSSAATAASSSSSGGASAAANSVASAASSFLPSLLAGATGRTSALTSAVGSGGGGGGGKAGGVGSSGANGGGGGFGGLGGRRGAVLAPKRFVQRLKRDNEAFRSFMHQVRK